MYTLNGDRRGTTIRCMEGNLWITQIGDYEDYAIEAGQEFTITRHGKVVIQGITASRACLIQGTATP
jgi:hypothetical protein